MKKDKLWFWTAHRYWGYEQIRTNTFYESNSRRSCSRRTCRGPAPKRSSNASDDIRLTWQMSREEQDVRLLQHRAAHRPNTGRWPARSSPTRRICRTCRTTLRDACRSARRFRRNCCSKRRHGQHHRNLDARAGRRFDDVEGLSGDGAQHRDQFPRLRGEFLQQLHVTAVVPQLADLRHRVARVQVGHDAAGGAGRHRHLDQQGHRSSPCATGRPFQVSVRTTPYTTHERLVADLGVYGQDTWTSQALDGERRPALGLPQQQGRRAGCAGRHLDRCRGTSTS